MQKSILLSNRWIILSIVVFAFVLGVYSESHADLTFQGKVITFIVPSSAGGGTDVFARFIARHIDKYIPGKPNIVVRNMVAAGGIASGNYVYKAKTNGRTALVSSAKSVTTGMLGPKGIEYELEKMIPIYASPIGNNYWAKSEIIKKPTDIMTAKGLIFGHSDILSGGPTSFIWPMRLIGFKVDKLITGFGGSGDARLAFLTGEINVCGGSTVDYNATMKPYVEKGEVVVIFQTGVYDEDGKIIREIPDVPTVPELYEQIHGKQPSGPDWEVYKLVVGQRTYGKTLLLPPNTPKEITKIYSDATAKMVKDPAFLKEAEKLIPGSPHLFGEKLIRSYPEGVGGDPKILDYMKKYYIENHGVVFD